MSNMKKLLESIDEIAFANPNQKPGDQVRGTDNPPFTGRLVGEDDAQPTLTYEDVANAWKQVFPNSSVGVSKAFGGGYTFKFRLAKDKSEVSNGILDNDPLSYSALLNTDGTFKEYNTFMFVKPPEGANLVYGSERFRKKTIKNATRADLIKRFEQVRGFVSTHASNLKNIQFDISEKLGTGMSESDRFLGEPYIREEDDDNVGNMNPASYNSDDEECPACDGTGKDYNEEGNEYCLGCGGMGYLVRGFVESDDSLKGSASCIVENNDELYNGCYVRDEQTDGPNGEVFIMNGDPYDRRVRIEDKDGRGWYVNPTRLTFVDENDPAVQKWFENTSEEHGPDCGCEICNQNESIDEAAPVSNLAKLRKAVSSGEIKADQVSKDKEGNIIFRKGYFYRNGMDSSKYSDQVDQQITKLEIPHEIVGSGDHWAAFKGGATVAKSSHWWVKVRILDTAPVSVEESIDEITETLKAQFEDYVKNKAEPEDKKERVTITYTDGHVQTKSVTEKEKKNYETSSHVKKVEPAKDTKGRIDDAKLDEVFGQSEPDKYNKKGEQEYIKRLKKQIFKKPTDKKKVIEGASSDDVANAITRRIIHRHPDIIHTYGIEAASTAIDEIAASHAGAEELGTSDISIMVDEVIEILESCCVTESTNKIATLEFKTENLIESFEFRSAMRNRFNQLYIAGLISDSDTPFRKMSPNCSKKINESSYHNEIKNFIDTIVQFDLPSNTKILIGDTLAVLDFEIMFAFQEISVRGFTTPKEISDIQTYPDGKTKKIVFTDGDYFPRQMPVTYDGRPMSYSAFFKTEEEAKKAQSWLTAALPTKWDIDWAINLPTINRNQDDIKESKNKKAVQEAKTASIARGILSRKLADLERINPTKVKELQDKFQDVSQKLASIREKMPNKVKEDFPTSLAPAGTDPNAATSTTASKPPATPAAAPTPIAAQPKTTAQQQPVPAGTPTAAPGAGQPTPPAAGQAGGAPVTTNPGAPQPPTGGQVNAATTPIEQMKNFISTVAANPGAAKQLATKINTTLR